MQQGKQVTNIVKATATLIEAEAQLNRVIEAIQKVKYLPNEAGRKQQRIDTAQLNRAYMVYQTHKIKAGAEDGQAKAG